MVGRHHDRRPGRHRAEHVGDEPVGGDQLGVVVIAEAVLVADLVDAVVVAVHERLAGGGEPGDLGHERRRDPVAAEPHAVEVAGAEAAVGELGPGHHRRAVPGEGRHGLELRAGVGLAGVAVPCRPAQHVEDLALDGDAVPDEAVLARRRPGADRSQGGGRGGRQDRADRAAAHRRQGRRQVAAGTELVPADAVEHQEHDPLGLRHDAGSHGGGSLPGSMSAGTTLQTQAPA